MSYLEDAAKLADGKKHWRIWQEGGELSDFHFGIQNAVIRGKDIVVKAHSMEAVVNKMERQIQHEKKARLWATGI